MGDSAVGAGGRGILELGELVGRRYALERLLAHRASAEVYQAFDMEARCRVVVNVFPADLSDAERFAAQTQAWVGLEHPNLVPLRDAGRHRDAHYLVFELIDGTTLAERWRSGPLSVTEANRVGGDIARGLAFLHRHGLVHGDVRPATILLATDGRALLADVGAAQLTGGDRPTGTRSPIGTAAYRAPEQVTGVAVTPAAEIYALGLVLGEVLSGRQGFTTRRAGALAARQVRAPGIPSDLTPPLNALLCAMTSRDPTDRPDAAAVAARLAALARWDPAAETGELQSADAAVVAPTEREALPSSKRSVPAWTFNVLAAAAAIVALTGLVLASGGQDSAPADSTPEVAAPATTSRPTETSPAPTVPSTTRPATTTARPASTAPTSTVPPLAANTAEAGQGQGQSLAELCADLDARRQAIDAEKQQIEELYRDDPETRERLKRELEAEKEAIDAQKQALGC